MEYCKECGSEVSEDDTFCAECGTPVEVSGAQQSQATCSQCEEPLEESDAFCLNCGAARNVEGGSPPTGIPPNEPTSINPEKQKPKKRMATWKKVLLSVGVAFIILLFGAYKFAENHFDPMKDLVKMDEAVLNNDVDGFMKFIKVDKEIPFDKESFFTYIKDYEWENGLKSSYNDLIEREKEDPSPLQKELLSVDGEPIFKVKDDKKLLGLFKGYTLHAVPVKVSATSNLDDTEIKIMDKEVVLEESEEWNDIGTFYPGIYEIEATTKTEFGDFVVTKEYEVKAEEYSDLYIEYEYGTFSIDVDYDYEDAVLFVDGENTKKKLSDVHELGPVPLDSNVKVHAEWKDDKDKIIRSNTEQLDEDQTDYVYLEFDERIALEEDDIDEIEHEVAEFILDFRMAYEDAVNYADYSDIASFMKPGSEEEKDLKKFVKDMDDASYYYDFEENTVTSVKEKDDKNYEVETNEQFTFHDEDGSVYEYDRDKVYFIEVIDGDYKVHNIDYKDTKKNKIN